MRNQLLSIQALRAVAALLVVIFHVTQSWVDEFGLLDRNVFPAGSSGVDIFFVISGFIMCYTTAAPADRSPLKFAGKRLVRILPLYYGLTLLVFLVAMAAPSLLANTQANFEHLLKSLAFIPYARADGGVFPILFLGWTLNYEMFFYLVFALALFFQQRALSIVIVTMTALVIVGATLPMEGLFARFYTNEIILNFVWGCLLYAAWARWPRAFGAHLWWLGLIGVIAIILQPYVAPALPRSIGAGLPATLIVAAALGFVFPAGAARDVSVKLGDASYSIYLVHPFVVELAAKALIKIAGASPLTAGIHLVVSILATCLVSIAIFNFFERPISAWLRTARTKHAPPATRPEY